MKDRYAVITIGRVEKFHYLSEARKAYRDYAYKEPVKLIDLKDNHVIIEHGEIKFTRQELREVEIKQREARGEREMIKDVLYWREISELLLIKDVIEEILKEREEER